jgi:hypothetical protein
MAGDWLKFEKTTMDKPEVYEMAGILGIDPDAVVGKLLRVWAWFDEQSRDGNAPVTVAALLNRITGVPEFVQAMKSVGWLIESNGRLIIPEYDRHNGNNAKSRALTKKRVEKLRSGNGGSVTKTEQERYQRREEKSIITLTSNKARGTLEELKAFAVELGMPASDGESMFHHWESNGWRNGSSPSKDWQAGMRKWKSQGWLPSQKNPTNGKPRILPDIGGRCPSAVLNLKDAKPWVHDPKDDETNF